MRPYIPVRDGLHLPKREFRPRWMPEVGQVEYMRGWWMGWVAGAWAGAIAVGILAGAYWPKLSPYQPIYEEPAHKLVGWCGGPAPKAIPQQSDDVDITWRPQCK